MLNINVAIVTHPDEQHELLQGMTVKVRGPDSCDVRGPVS